MRGHRVIKYAAGVGLHVDTTVHFFQFYLQWNRMPDPLKLLSGLKVWLIGVWFNGVFLCNLQRLGLVLDLCSLIVLSYPSPPPVRALCAATAARMQIWPSFVSAIDMPRIRCFMNLNPYLTCGVGCSKDSTPALRPQNGPNVLPRQTLRS